MPPSPKPKVVHAPWGGIVGLLTGCVMTLLGVVQGHEPETILLRAAIGGAVTGMLAKAATMVIRAK
jgi:hypothetical protein